MVLLPATLFGYNQLHVSRDVQLPALTCPALWPYDAMVTDRRELQVKRIESFVGKSRDVEY